MLRGSGIETLETLPVENGDAETPVIEGEDQTLIQEREGVPYINQLILDTGPQTLEELNQDFKKLVDSVISVD